MKERPLKDFGFDTRAIHAGQRPDPYTGANFPPPDPMFSYGSAVRFAKDEWK